MKLCIILGVIIAAANFKIRATENEKGKMIAHPLARVHMLVQSVLYKIYS